LVQIEEKRKTKETFENKGLRTALRGFELKIDEFFVCFAGWQLCTKKKAKEGQAFVAMLQRQKKKQRASMGYGA